MPWAVVLKLALSPGQLVRETNASAIVGVFTVNLAELVTLLQMPVTFTEYVPALPAVIPASVSELVLSPGSGVPSLIHWKLNGPVPCAVVLNATLSPGQFVRDTSGSAVVSVCTTNRATAEVTLPHALVTTTS